MLRSENCSERVDGKFLRKRPKNRMSKRTNCIIKGRKSSDKSQSLYNSQSCSLLGCTWYIARPRLRSNAEIS